MGISSGTVGLGSGIAQGAAGGAMGGPVGAIVGAGIGAVGSLLGAKKNSNSANKAVQAQTQASNAALAEQKRIYDLQRSDNAPYLAASQQALGSLQGLAAQGHQMTLPAAYTGGGMASLSKLAQPTPPPMVGLGNMSAPQGRMVPQGQMPPQGQPQGQPMVTLRAPTGQIGRVPAEQADALIQRGAVRVG